MSDNKTAHLATEYDSKVRATIPNYDLFQSETINIVKTINPNPQKWLDTGCGTGYLVSIAHKVFSNTSFTISDPSTEMLDIAKAKLSEAQNVRVLAPVTSQDISLEADSVDIITAIQAHHYMDSQGRSAATENCFRMLKSGGVYVTFENTAPLTDAGVKIGLERWKGFQLSQGKSYEEAEKHASRYGQEYFPITIEEQVQLLRQTGFKTVEILWVSYMQAGFYAVK